MNWKAVVLGGLAYYVAAFIVAEKLAPADS